VRSGPDHLYHAIPLFYVPALAESGRLYSAARLPDGVRPRPTAILRKRKLGLEDVVHLSLVPKTPLLTDKHAKGYPHALLRFPATLLDRSDTSLLKWNTKRWAHRAEFAPISSPEEKKMFLEKWREGAYPSAEALVARSLDLSLADALLLPHERFSGWLAAFSSNLPPLSVTPENFAFLAPCPYDAKLESYFLLCAHLRPSPAPPEPAFD
jgi:hypothetical protein